MSQTVKKVKDLTPADFKKYAIWSWYENIEDESLVTPVSDTYLLSSDYEEFDPLFILSELKLYDGTKLQGEISIKLDTRKVYMIGFFKKDKILTFSLQSNFKKLDRLSRISNWLQKPIEKIFPVHYTTAYFFNDGTAIMGEIDLKSI